MSAVNREHPPLWKQGHRKGYDRTATSAKELMKCYSSKPDPQPWSTLCESSLVVGQEFVLTCFFLARLRIAHQEETGSRTEPLSSQILSLVAVTLSLTLVAFFSNSNQGRRRQNAKTRLIDSFLLATLLRLLAAALKTLTASYSSDTVIALSVGGMIVHLLGCDYHYANGATPVGYSSSSPRPPFLGGTMSLNAAFFSTALLVSRLESNWTVHAFVSTSVTVFAFYPATRHGLFVKSPREAPFVILTTIVLLFPATWVLLQRPLEKFVYAGILIVVCGIAPTWKKHLQQYKVTISGPWDIPCITKEDSSTVT